MEIEIEKRKHKRAKTALEVQCASFGIEEIFVSSDVSAGGIFLNTPSPLASGSDVELSFRLSPDGPDIACSGRVVYALPGVGMGIQFLDARGEIDMALTRPGGASN